MKIFDYLRISVAGVSLALAGVAFGAAGDAFEFSGLKFQVLNEEEKTAKVVGVAEEQQNMAVPALATFDGVDYTVTEIYDQAFENCKIMETVDLPNTLTAIRYGAFGQCSSLKELKIPENVTILESWVFEKCTALKNVEFPESLKTIGYHAFDSCTALEEAILPREMDEILTHAFIDCKSLKRVLLPKNLKVLEASVFLECTSLEYLPLPDGLTTIGGSALGYCTSLKEITLPTSVTTLDIGAFDSLTALENLYVLSKKAPTAYKATFNRIDFSKTVVNIPTNCLDNFRYAVGWNQFAKVGFIVSIDGGEYSIEAGKTLELEATVPAYMTAQWVSSNPDVATVDDTGLVTGLTNGDVTISFVLTDPFGDETRQEATVKVDGSSAVELTAADNAGEYEYYTVDGKRIGKTVTAPGLYIRVNNGHAERIIIK